MRLLLIATLLFASGMGAASARVLPAAILIVAGPSTFDAANPRVVQAPKGDPRLEEGLRKGEDELAARKFTAALDAFKKAYERSKKLSVPALWGMVRAYHGLAEH